MKRSRFTEEQIIAVLKEHELGAKTADLCRKHGISEPGFPRRGIPLTWEGNRGKTLGSRRYQAGCPGQRTRSGKGGMTR